MACGPGCYPTRTERGQALIPGSRSIATQPPTYSALRGVRLHPDGLPPSSLDLVRCWERLARDPDGRDTLRLAHLGRGVALGSRLGATRWPADPLADWWGPADGDDRLVQPHAWVARHTVTGAEVFGASAGHVRALLASRRWRVWDFSGSLLEPE